MPEIRLVNQALFYDELDLLYTAGVNGVFLFKLNYIGQYKPELASKVDIKGAHIKIKLTEKNSLEKMLEWCKGIKIDRESNMIISWNIMCVSMNDLTQNGKLLVQFESLTTKDEKVLDVLVFLKLRYFLTSTSEGNIHIFKYLQTGKIETTQRLVHTFMGHHKSVTSISSY